MLHNINNIKTKMPSLYSLFQQAQKKKVALGAFNFATLEQLKGIIQAAQKLNSPVILATSENEMRYIGAYQAVALVRAYREEIGLPFFLHLDHAHSFRTVQEAIKAGYDSVHFDGSALSFKENIQETKKVVDYVKKNKKKKILVEGELGYLRGKSTIHQGVEIRKEDLTDPNQAEEFVKKTGVDCLAVAIGNIHGIIKKRKKLGNPHLFLDRLKEIKKRVGSSVFLVLHGGSGTPVQDLRKSIDIGIRKVNINTEIRLAYRSVLEKVLKKKPNEIVPYYLMKEVIEAVAGVVEEKIRECESNKLRTKIELII